MIFQKRETAGAVEDVTNNVTEGLLKALLTNTPITKEQVLSLPIVSSAVDKISKQVLNMVK